MEIASRLEIAIAQTGLNLTVERIACMSMCVNGPNVRLLPIGKNWHQVDRHKIGDIIDFVHGLQRK